MTTINIGDQLNLGDGAVQVGSFTTLKSLAFVAPPPMNQPAPNAWGDPGFSLTTPWVAGYANDFATTGAPALYWSGLTGERGIYPTAAGLAAGLGLGVISVNAASQVVITPRLANAAEQASLANTPLAAGHDWVSFAMCSFPAGLPVPRYFEIECEMPPLLAGVWPAFWEIDINDTWNGGPETDTFERPGTIGMTSSIHTGQSTNSAGVTTPNDPNWAKEMPPEPTTTYLQNGLPNGSSSATQDIPWPDEGVGMHRYGCLTLADKIAFYYDRVCVWVAPTPVDIASNKKYAIINFGLGGPESWPGTMPAGTTSVGSMTIGDFQAYEMPATYVTISSGGATPTPVPVPIPTPTPTGTPTMTASPSGSTAKAGSGQIVDATGNVWIVTAGKVVERNGSVMSGSNIVEIAYVAGVIWETDGTFWWSWSNAGNAWSSAATQTSPLVATPSPTPTPTPVPTPAPTPAKTTQAQIEADEAQLQIDLTKLANDAKNL